jgi:hypothetical protein
MRSMIIDERLSISRVFFSEIPIYVHSKYLTERSTRAISSRRVGGLIKAYG